MMMMSAALLRYILAATLLLIQVHGRKNTELEKLLVRYKLNHMDTLASHIGHDFADEYAYDDGEDGQSPKETNKKNRPLRRFVKTVKKGVREVVGCAVNPFGQKQPDQEAEQMKPKARRPKKLRNKDRHLNLEEAQKKMDAEAALSEDERKKMKEWYTSNQMLEPVSKIEPVHHLQGAYGYYVPKEMHSLNPVTFVKGAVHWANQQWFNFEMTLIESMLGPYIIGSKVLLERSYHKRMKELRGDFLQVYQKSNIFKKIAAGVTHLPQIIWHSFSHLVLRSFAFIKDKFAYILLDFYNQVKKDIADSFGVDSKPFTLDAEFMKLESLQELAKQEQETALPAKPCSEQDLHRWRFSQTIRVWSWKLGFKSLDIWMDAIRRISKHNLLEWLKYPITTILFPVLDLPVVKTYFTDTVVVLILDYVVDMAQSIATAFRQQLQRSVEEGVAIEFELDNMERATTEAYAYVYEARTKKERALWSYEQLLVEYREKEEKKEKLQEECDALEREKKELQKEIAIKTVMKHNFNEGPF